MAADKQTMTRIHSLDAMTWTAAATASADHEQRRRRCTVVCCVISGALFLGAWVAVMMCAIPKASFSVAIDSVSGLDDLDQAAAARGDLRLNTEFSLTLRVASKSYGRRACVDPGTYLEVAYRCVKLATSTGAAPLCAGPHKSAEQRVVARGTGVRVPGHLLDSLAEGVRRGVQVFDVTLRRSGGDEQPADDNWMASCGGRRVGAALGGACDRSDSAWYDSCSGPANNGGSLDNN